MKRVYMYSFHERAWHWMQAFVILVLLYTGLEIHLPNRLLMCFNLASRIHVAFGFIFVINAGLGLLYHIFTNQLRQFIPEPRDFFSASIRQAVFYLGGIFRGDPHPFEKSPDRKLNPLQKITYLAILNVLLPFQLVTGLILMSAHFWPSLIEYAGGLALLATLHTLAAWLFGAFVIMHVYLTTTGHTPLSSITAMITGWEDVEDGHRKN